MSDAATLFGTLGTALLVIAFGLNAVGQLRVSYVYLGMNLVGAGMAAWASYLIGFTPFVVLEAVWFLAALTKLIHMVATSR